MYFKRGGHCLSWQPGLWRGLLNAKEALPWGHSISMQCWLGLGSFFLVLQRRLPSLCYSTPTGQTFGVWGFKCLVLSLTTEMMSGNKIKCEKKKKPTKQQNETKQSLTSEHTARCHRERSTLCPAARCALTTSCSSPSGTE